jgi:hypothetical protein
MSNKLKRGIISTYGKKTGVRDSALNGVVVLRIMRDLSA